MTAEEPDRIRGTDRQDGSSAASRFWQNCERYHDLAERFARDIAVVHPGEISGRLRSCPWKTECDGYCRTTVVYYDHVPNSRRGENVLR